MKAFASLLLVGLIIQALLGGAVKFASSSVSLTIHTGLALVLLLGSIFFAISARNTAWMRFAAISLVGIIVAGASGLQYVNTGVKLFSWTMALGGVTAIISYAWGLVSLGKKSI